MNEQEYRKHPAIAQSTLKLLRRSPAHAKWAMDNPKESTATMQIGTALHGLVLEGKTDFAVMPESAKGNTNAAKAVKADFLLSNSGKIVLSHAEAEKIGAMALSLSQHSTAMRLLRICDEKEKSVFWPELEMEFKARFDGVCPLGIVDLKTTTNADIADFERSIYKYGYHIQAAHYLAGAAANNLPCENFYIVAVENEPPYCASVFQLDHAAIEAGEKERQKLIKLYKECLVSGNWPGYPDKIQSITLPKWAFYENNQEENENEY